MTDKTTGAATNARTVQTLNNLIQTCKDGQEGFATAADHVEDTHLKSLFREYSEERAQFALELQAEVRRLGADPEKSGSTAGALHRGWINLRSALTDRDDQAILSEAERGEDSAVRNYEEALKEPLPMEIRTLVNRQYAQVKEAHDRVRDLRDAAGNIGDIGGP